MTSNKTQANVSSVTPILCLLFLALAATPAHSAETSNRLAENKLSSNRLSATRLASSRLAGNKLSGNRLQANPDTAEILQTEDGREVYSYIISCALPSRTRIEATIPGAADTAPPETLYRCKNGRCSFPGSIGLAEHWLDRRLSPKGQRWVSACLLARVNAYGVSVRISMRGDAPSLSVSPEEMERFSLQEGAFFGNLFADPDSPLDWNACRGKDKSAASDEGDLRLRACTEPDPEDPTHTQCGFKYAGECGNYRDPVQSSGRDHACRSFESDEGTYSNCIAPRDAGQAGDASVYREVITTYVRH